MEREGGGGGWRGRVERERASEAIQVTFHSQAFSVCGRGLLCPPERNKREFEERQRKKERKRKLKERESEREIEREEGKIKREKRQRAM